MWNFIDEAGTFCWTPKEKSFFAGLSIASRSLLRIEAAFAEWKQKALSLSDADEVKGATLTREQLEVFVKWVVLPHRDFWITAVGIDTAQTRREIVEVYREQAAEVCDAAAKCCDNRSNAKLGRDYRKFGKWLRGRSPQNVLWLFGLATVVQETLQHSVARHLGREDDDEFEDWSLLIDRTSVVQTPRHELLWRVWLRNLLYQRMANKEAFSIPADWRTRNHPFSRKYLRGEIADLSDLFRNHMVLRDSKVRVGLQLADVCATIVRRRFCDEWFSPFDRLKPRIVHRVDDRPVLVIQLDEACLSTDSPEQRLRFLEVLHPADEPHSETT
jgi:Protein of unknown function (DUF3800)